MISALADPLRERPSTCKSAFLNRLMTTGSYTSDTMIRQQGCDRHFFFLVSFFSLIFCGFRSSFFFLCVWGPAPIKLCALGSLLFLFVLATLVIDYTGNSPVFHCAGAFFFTCPFQNLTIVLSVFCFDFSLDGYHVLLPILLICDFGLNRSFMGFPRLLGLLVIRHTLLIFKTLPQLVQSLYLHYPWAIVPSMYQMYSFLFGF